MAARKRAQTIYPKELGELGHIESLVVAEALAIAKPSAPEFETLLSVIRSEREESLLAALSRHYGIPESGTIEARLKMLALCLARDHVPAFSLEPVVRRGRPSQKNYLAYLLKLSVARKPGRPRSSKIAGERRYLLKRVCEICEVQGYKGHGARTKALKDFCKSIASKVGKSPLSVERSLGLSRLRKALNTAEKLYPKIAAKLPR